MATEMASRRNRVVEFSRDHGIHAFVFLSFIFAETLKLIIETLTNSLRYPIPVGELIRRPEAALLLFAVTVLTLQYWWVVFESAAFYGNKLGYFAMGVLEAGFFYAIAFFLKDFYLLWPDAAKYNLQVERVFFLFIGLIVVFMIVDPVKYAHYGQKNGETKKKLRKREVLRGVGVLLCLLGGFGPYPRLAACLFFLLVIAYTISSKKLQDAAL